ncbi:MAG TPA: diaminopimelate epimerase [Pyrinomonadaceae bacterium]|nr:diaminopimelate epimerase [Pyrinomonadaceae bacterium]
MRFAKFHGYGNDYLVFEAGELEAAGFPSGLAPAGEVGRFGNFVRRVCDRHTGAGGDGVATLERLASGAADYRLRIFNADGSEAAMSGNGSRCAAAYLHHRRLWADEELRLATRAGVKLYRLKEKVSPTRYRFEAETGRPVFDSDSIPFAAPAPLREVRGHALALPDGRTVEVTALQMCNPNCVVFVEDFERTDWRRLGAQIEPHRQFPEKTNVEFVRVRDRENVEARVWERGVGETLSSGTGACAAAVASAVNDLTGRRVRVSMPGGTLEVLWREADGEVLLTGEAEAVYSGELFDAA